MFQGINNKLSSFFFFFSGSTCFVFLGGCFLKGLKLLKVVLVAVVMASQPIIKLQVFSCFFFFFVVRFKVEFH